ncbi:MAG: hypothetical protein ISR65_10090 [Bacteriovoracaceae bacterium]|nr:hypothetical protein [Bacteriovoracaceae bacterium]
MFFREVIKVAILLCLISSCYPNKDSPENSRKALGEMNIPFNEDEFIKAVKNNDYVVVKYFLNSGMNPNQHTTIKGTFPWVSTLPILALAVDNNDIKMLNLLLKHGADIDSTPDKSQSASDTTTTSDTPAALTLSGLMWAVMTDNPKMVRALLDKGASADIKLRELLSAGILEIALTPFLKGKQVNQSMIRNLISHGADVNYSGFKPMTLLSQVIHNSPSLASVKTLVNCGAILYPEVQNSAIKLVKDEIRKLTIEGGNNSKMTNDKLIELKTIYDYLNPIVLNSDRPFVENIDKNCQNKKPKTVSPSKSEECDTLPIILHRELKNFPWENVYYEIGSEKSPRYVILISLDRKGPKTNVKDRKNMYSSTPWMVLKQSNSSSNKYCIMNKGTHSMQEELDANYRKKYPIFKKEGTCLNPLDRKNRVFIPMTMSEKKEDLIKRALKKKPAFYYLFGSNKEVYRLFLLSHGEAYLTEQSKGKFPSSSETLPNTGNICTLVDGKLHSRHVYYR